MTQTQRGENGPVFLAVPGDGRRCQHRMRLLWCDVVKIVMRGYAQTYFGMVPTRMHGGQTRVGNIDASGAKDTLLRLNEQLERACPGWRLELGGSILLPGQAQNAGFLSSFTTKNYLTLCLYFNDVCVSSIQFEDALSFSSEPTLEIASVTLKTMQGRKFNRFLRACAILLAAHMTLDDEPVTVLHSGAVTAASAHLLITHYDVHLDENLVTYLRQLKAEGKDSHITYKLLDDYLFVRPLPIDVNIADNVGNAEA